MYMRFEKLGSELKPLFPDPAPAPLTFPDHPVIPTTPLVFDDTELARACKDCRWYSHSAMGASCKHDRLQVFDPVNGWQWVRAREARAEGKPCGSKGNLWEAKLPHKPDWRGLSFLWGTLLVCLSVAAIFILR